MDVESRLNQVRARAERGLSAEDADFVLSILDEKDKRIRQLEKKAEVLANQVLELTQEIENVKSDFDPGANR